MKTKTNDLKAILRPLIEQIVEEKLKKMLLEERGILSNLITEVTAGLAMTKIGNQLNAASRIPAPVSFAPELKESVSYVQKKSDETRRKVLSEIAKSNYNGIDLFEGVKSINEVEEKASEGVDLSSLAKLGAFRGK